MKISLLIFTLIAQFSFGQSITFNISKNYVNNFGEHSDMVSFAPLFKLESNSIHNKTKSQSIRKKPSFTADVSIAYGFIYFAGNNNSIFKNELVFLVENYNTNSPKIYFDKNGNLDFTDDGDPVYFKDEFTLKLSNSKLKEANFIYNISKSRITKENEVSLSRRYAAKYSKSAILSPKYWLVLKTKSVRVSHKKIDGKPITILIGDQDKDGVYTFNTYGNSDRIVLLDEAIDQTQSLLPFLRQGEPIDHNAVFELYGKKYYVKHLSKNGNELTISETDKNTRVMFNKGTNVSKYIIGLLSGKTEPLKTFIKDKPLLIDVGGTWCGGCITQETTIKKMYNDRLVDVVGIFAHDTKQRVENYITKHNINWPVGLISKEFKDKFRINSYPTYILISKEGNVQIIEQSAENLYTYFKKNIAD